MKKIHPKKKELAFISKEQQHMIDYVVALNNKLKRNIFLLLTIYRELSTKQLSNKLNKAKSTIIRNVESLIKSGYILVREETAGQYPKKIYRLNPDKSYVVQGQKLRSLVPDHPEFVLSYLNHFKAIYVNLKNTMESACNYLERLEKELITALKNKPEDIFELMKDNLGTVIQTYLNKKQMIELFNVDLNLKDLSGRGDLKDLDLPKGYLYLQMVLPIKRLIETENSDEWVKDGTLWP